MDEWPPSKEEQKKINRQILIGAVLSFVIIGILQIWVGEVGVMLFVFAALSGAGGYAFGKESGRAEVKEEEEERRREEEYSKSPPL